MAKETVNILKDKIDIVELLAQLNAALSEEWLAFYQYWVGSFCSRRCHARRRTTRIPRTCCRRI